MTTPALLAYVDDLLTEPSHATDVAPAWERGSSLSPVSRDASPPVHVPALSVVAPVATEPSRPSPAQMAQAIAEKSGTATAATTAPTGRWLRMTVDSDHYAVELLRVQEVDAHVAHRRRARRGAGRARRDEPAWPHRPRLRPRSLARRPAKSLRTSAPASWSWNAATN
jgi:hypothetical protein